jgi:signal peptidase I
MTSNSPPTANVDFIKRCIGTPGDTVYVINRQVYRNGVAVPEPYTKWVNPPTESDRESQPDESSNYLANTRISYDMKIVGNRVYSRDYAADGQVEVWSSDGTAASADEQETISKAPYGKVPQGYFLMLGDHRSNSNDGHVWGFVPRANIIGKAICVFWPPTRLGLVDLMTEYPRRP